MAQNAPSLVIQTAAASDVGCKRKLNEDSYLVREDLGLWVVADGMGGHAAGDVASQAICRHLNALSAEGEANAFLHAVAGAIQSAHSELLVEAQQRGDGHVIGSTVVALMIAQGHFACLWAGDSRLYLLRDGTLRQFSKDHSFVQQLVDSGTLTKEEAERHPQGNVVTRAVGAMEVLELERKHEALMAGDALLLCSDGLTGLVSDEEIQQILLDAQGQVAVDRLIELTLERGAHDNVTIILVTCQAAEDPSYVHDATVIPGTAPNPVQAGTLDEATDPILSEPLSEPEPDPLLGDPPQGLPDVAPGEEDPLAAILADGPQDSGSNDFLGLDDPPPSPEPPQSKEPKKGFLGRLGFKDKD